MTDKRKREARDVNERTGWGYQFCRRLVDVLGYDRVSNAVDAATDLATCGRELNAAMSAAARETKP